MSENNKPHFTNAEITKLEEARQLYTHRARDWINRRAEELLKFGKMQASVIARPNQMELQEQVQKVQKCDLEIKRLTDLIQAASVLMAYNEIPHLFDGVKNVKDQIKLAHETIIDLNKDLQKSTIEEVFAVSLLRDFAESLRQMYPDTNVFEQASFLRAQRKIDGSETEQEANYVVDGKQVSKEEFERVSAEREAHRSSQAARDSAAAAGIILS
ncbi:hypothetical protein AVU38_gp097 [Ralstonia phage RSL2]|uniref:Uncharacterized protein n=1 Tax=Ralstonia phage RSL2 TaxID=1585840 RepID=A0A0A8J892_9CAUD|nr:hypothetical protein AVU38_gp097 [Ralstonia phage RSL2]BAQ02625.1 hypothetical protein [Ralstonia phage RSL2]